MKICAQRLLVVGVMGSGKDPWLEYAKQVAGVLASKPCHLLTGSGGGVMLSVAKAFCEDKTRKGLSIGIVPCESEIGEGVFRPKHGYPNPWVELAINTPLPTGGPNVRLSRNHINILTSDVLVVLPGSQGTLDEVGLAIRYEKHMILFGPNEPFAQFPKSVVRTSDIGDVSALLDRVAATIGQIDIE